MIRGSRGSMLLAYSQTLNEQELGVASLNCVVEWLLLVGHTG